MQYRTVHTWKKSKFYHQIPQNSFVSVVLRGFDLLIHNYLDAFSADSEIARMAFLFFLLSYLVDSEFCLKIFLRNPGGKLLSDHMLSTICRICIVLQAPDTFQAFFRWPLRCFPPTGLSVLSAQRTFFGRPEKKNYRRRVVVICSVTFNHSRYQLSSARLGR